jgi:hypothetical protein
MDEVILARVLNQQAEMFALCADIEGMKVANVEQLVNNKSLVYHESEFKYVATSLRNIASTLYQLGYR